MFDGILPRRQNSQLLPQPPRADHAARFFCFAAFFLLLTGTACTANQSPAPAPEKASKGQVASASSSSAGAPDTAKSRAIDFEHPPSIPDLATGKTKPLTPDEANEQLKDAAHDWFYGPGLGRTMLNVGTIVIFPPYVVYLLGNAALQLGGYHPVYVSDALPEKARDGVNNAYDEVTSKPGQLTAAIAGEDSQKK